MSDNSKIAFKYASALFNAANLEGIGLDVLKEIQALKDVFTLTESKWNLLNSQIHTKTTRVSFVEVISSSMNLNKIILNLLIVMSKNQRLNLIKDVSDKYENIYRAKNNEVDVQVLSRSEISQDQKIEIEGFLEKFLNKKVFIENQIDDSIIGGVIIKFGSFVLDNSVVNRLNSAKLLSKL